MTSHRAWKTTPPPARPTPARPPPARRPPPAARRPPPAQLCVVATQGHCVVATGLGNPKSRISGEGFPEGRAAWSRRAWKNHPHTPFPPISPIFLGKNDPKIKNVTKWVAVAPFGAFRPSFFIPRASRSHWDTSRAKNGQTIFFFALLGAPGAPCWGQPLRAGYTGCCQTRARFINELLSEWAKSPRIC